MLKPSTSMKFSFTVVRLLLGDVEQHAVRVGEMMSAVRAALEERESRLPLRSRAQGKGARARALEDLDGGVALAQPRASPLGVLHFHAEMVEPGRAARLARIDVEADGAVADGDGALRTLIGRGLHAEHRLIKSALERVLVADDGDVLDFFGHGSTT